MTDNPKAFLITLGCPKNEVDSEQMAARLISGGYEITDDLSQADVALVNTCSFIQAAAEESIDTILEVAGDERISADGVPVIVCGCLPSRYGADLEGEMPEVAAFVPCAQEGDVLSIVNNCLGRGEMQGLQSGDQSEDAVTSYILESASTADESAGEARAFAYVKISDGCSRHCAYCTIPMIRGPYRSFEYADIERDVATLDAAGVKEAVLIGQDTGIWGHDLGEGQTLASLLERLAKRFPNMWLRAMYTQPESITDELLDVMATYENVCPYLDIPMQHCSETVLASMGRSGSYDGLMTLIGKIRARVPGVAIRTTLMVGFPGETEEDFEELLRFVEQARFDYAGVFAFSPEEGTRACLMEGQLDEDEKAWRAEQIRTMADAVSADVISGRIRSDVSILVEGEESDGQLYGRTQMQAPEVDGVVYIDSGCPATIINATISDTLMYDMETL